jgi:hypothetical protein
MKGVLDSAATHTSAASRNSGSLGLDMHLRQLILFAGCLRNHAIQNIQLPFVSSVDI